MYTLPVRAAYAHINVTYTERTRKVRQCSNFHTGYPDVRAWAWDKDGFASDILYSLQFQHERTRLEE